MQLSWSLLLLLLLLLAAAVSSSSMATTVKPSLIVSSDEEPQPMMYHFIMDHRPTTLGQNYYLKPGQLVGSFSLDSGTLHVKHADGKRPISSKLNILFVATAKDVDASTKNKLDE